MAPAPIDIYRRQLVDYYDAVGPDYDDWSSGVHRRAAKRLVDLAAPTEGERALDIGCGTGLVTSLLDAAVGDSGLVIGVDLSTRMLELARTRSGPHTRLMRMPPEELVFVDSVFDLVTMGESFGHMSEPARALAEARRVLRPGGRVAVLGLTASLETPAQRLYDVMLRRLERVNPVIVPRPPDDRTALGEPSGLTAALAEAGFAGVTSTQMVTGGRARDAREWTELMLGAGPLPHSLVSVLGPGLRRSFEQALEIEMRDLGEEEAFRYHHAFTFAVGRREE